MKNSISLFFLGILSTLLIANDCSIDLETCWQNLEQKNTNQEKFGGRWVLIGNIIFHKKSRSAIKLDKICLHWHGEKIDKLHGSLYKKLPGKKFIPIEDNLLCDGAWNSGQQRLTLDFSDRTQTLGPINIFCLVLTIPDPLEATLKKGHFSLTKTYLPEPFSSSTQLNDLTLNIAQFISRQEGYQATRS